MRDWQRFAICYAPPKDSELARSGAQWLGWDAESGLPVAQPDLMDMPMALADMTAPARRFGFCGALKAPFRLAEGVAYEALRDETKRLARTVTAFAGPALNVKRSGRVLALAPGATAGQLSILASLFLQGLEGFRAPPSLPERHQHRKGLSDRQRALQAVWGHPFVLDEYRFRVPLTGEASPPTLRRTEVAARRFFGGLLAASLPVTEVCLAAEDRTGRFHIVERFALNG